MKKVIVLFVFLFSISLYAQYPVVTFNYERSGFNEGQPLPSETYFILNGAVSTQVRMVEMVLYANADLKKQELYSSVWKREFNNTKQSFSMPVHYKLRSDRDYTVVLNYYREAQQAEIENLRQELNYTLDAYVDLNFIQGKKSFSLVKNSSAMISDLNSIVNESLKNYRSLSNYNFEGFSDLVRDQIKAIEGVSYNRMFGKKADADDRESKSAMYLERLKTHLHLEAAHIFNSGLLATGDSKIIKNYPTVEQKSIITLNFGYGGVLLDHTSAETTIGHGVMAGLTIPLGKQAFAKEFFSRSAIVTGIYLNDFTGSGGEKLTGPVINKPVFLGLGYNIFQFMRVTAGGVVLTEVSGTQGLTLGDIQVKPFVGISADINLWIGLNKR